MIVTVEKKNGTTFPMPVRWSAQIGGLFTCTGLMTQHDVLQIPEINCASAPFAIYSGIWNEFGYDEDEDFFKNEDVIARIPYGDRGWNYK